MPTVDVIFAAWFALSAAACVLFAAHELWRSYFARNRARRFLAVDRELASLDELEVAWRLPARDHEYGA